MIRRLTVRLVKALALAAAVILVVVVKSVEAQESPQCTGTAVDKHWIEVRCAPGFATAQDFIRIFVRDGVTADRPWQENLDFTNSIWIFETGTERRASLIIDFHLDENSNLVADLYDDGNGDGRVRHVIRSGQPVVQENGGRWTLRVTALDGSWSIDGNPNFNLDISVDGPVVGAFDIPMYFMAGDKGQITALMANRQLSERYPWLDELQKLLHTDGQPDFLIHVRDSDRDGRPDYEWRQTYLPWPETSSYYRTTIMVNTEGDEVPISNSLLWPYLALRPTDLVKDYNRSDPPIQVDWQLGRIIRVAEFVASRGQPGNYFIYSARRVSEDALSRTNFENPFAFYDLAGAADGYPDLTVRFENYTANDPYFQPADADTWGRFPQPFQHIEYTWDQDRNRSWDYMVSLAGRHAIDTKVELPDFSLRTIPFADAPYWVTEREWDAATFVAAERDDYWTSEHIYVWDIGPATLYVTGYQTQPPDDAYSRIPAGFRGEYNFHFQAQPYLYFSPLDSKLHLLGAQKGLWNIDGSHQIEYENMDGDPYIDRWLYRDSDGAVLRQMAAFRDLLIYSDADRTILFRAEVPPAEFTTLPPRNQAEWTHLRDELASRQPQPPPAEFAAMLSRLAEPDAQIDGATVTDMRVADGRLYLTIDVGPAANVVAASEALGIDSLAPGSYLYTYDGATATLRELTPPRLALAGDGLSVSVAQPRELVPFTIAAVVQNQGLATASEVPFALVAESERGSRITIEEGTLTIPGGEEVEVNATWAAPHAGNWRLILTVGPAPDQSVAQVQQASEVTSVAASGRTLTDSLNVTGVGLSTLATAATVIVFILALAAMAATTGTVLWRKPD